MPRLQASLARPGMCSSGGQRPAAGGEEAALDCCEFDASFPEPSDRRGSAVLGHVVVGPVGGGSAFKRPLPQSGFFCLLNVNLSEEGPKEGQKTFMIALITLFTV